MCFSFSCQVYALRPPCCGTKHSQKWRCFSLGAEIKTRSRDLGDLDTAWRKPQDKLDQVFHTSKLHWNLHHLPSGFLLIHPLLCTHSVVRCCPCGMKNQSSWVDGSFAFFSDKSAALRQKNFVLKLFWITQTKGSAFVQFFKVFFAYRWFVSTFVCPCHFRSTHFTPNTLFASVNSESFMMSKPWVALKCRCNPNLRLFNVLRSAICFSSCEIYDNSQDHWRSLCNLFKKLQGRAIKSYENCKNYETYKNCEIYNNSLDHLRKQRSFFKGLQGGLSTVMKITKFLKTAKFMIIRKTIDKINEMYSKSCREGPSKVTRIAKFTIIRQTTYEINKIYSKCYREGPSKVTKITKFTIIRHTSYKIKKIYSKGCREGPLKVTKIAKITKFTKTAKFMIICHTTYKINKIYSKGCREDPSTCENYEIYENCEIYDNAPHHLQNQRNLFKGLQGRPFRKLRQLQKLQILQKLLNLLKSARP